MRIYEKPTITLMQDFLRSNVAPGKVFRKEDAVAWFAEHYPNIKPATVRMHVDAMSVNSKLRKHHSTVRPGSGHDLFYKLGSNQFRLWDQAHDPAPYYSGSEFPESPAANEDADETAEASNEISDDLGAREFALESDLRNYISRNLAVIEPGLKLYDDEGFTGIEFVADGRRIDILCTDRDGGL
jgi:hypothetical protein